MNMKKNYMKPAFEVVEIKLTKMICSSRGVTSPRGISYGGVDEEGSIDPESRGYNRDWDDE
jgi:hypothetical protein